MTMVLVGRGEERWRQAEWGEGHGTAEPETGLRQPEAKKDCQQVLEAAGGEEESCSRAFGGSTTLSAP